MMKKALFEMTDREREVAFWKARKMELTEQYKKWYPNLSASAIEFKVRRRLAREQAGW